MANICDAYVMVVVAYVKTHKNGNFKCRYDSSLSHCVFTAIRIHRETQLCSAKYFLSYLFAVIHYLGKLYTWYQILLIEYTLCYNLYVELN